MNISFEAPDKINGLMTITLETADYQPEVDKTLKDYRKRANIPGFRPGQAPMGMIKRQFGPSVKVEAINKMLGEKLYEYVRENKIQMLGEPLPSDKQEQLDFESDKPLTFKFDIAVAPEFEAKLSGKDKIAYYNITVEDKLIDQQVEMYQSRAGHYEKVENFDAEQRDMLKGDLRELDAKGNVKEGGITVADAVLMPQYMKVDDQKKLFDGAKLGDIITWNPRKAYPESDVEVSSLLKIQKEEVKDHEGDFTFQITEISRYVKAEINQELFDQTFGEGTVKSEKEFRQKIADQISQQFKADSDYKFLLDVRAHMEKKVGKLEFPEALLKRVMLNNNKDKGQDFVEKNFEASIKELGWHMIKEQLVAAQEIKVEDADLKNVAKEAARAQFAQYGMSNVPDEYLENYAAEMLKKRENVDGRELNRLKDTKGWYREETHGREVSVGAITVESDLQSTGKYRMTAIIDGQRVSHEITQKQYDKFMAVDDYHRMKLFSKVFPEVEMKGNGNGVNVGAAILAALTVGTGVAASIARPRPAPEVYVDRYEANAVYHKPGVIDAATIAAAQFESESVGRQPSPQESMGIGR